MFCRNITIISDFYVVSILFCSCVVYHQDMRCTTLRASIAYDCMTSVSFVRAYYFIYVGFVRIKLIVIGNC